VLLDFRHLGSYVMQHTSHVFGAYSVIEASPARNVCQRKSPKKYRMRLDFRS
jgi:hypothetical protein